MNMAPGNEFRHNQAPINVAPYATPRVTSIPLVSIDTLPGRHVLPLASNLGDIGALHDNEPARREIVGL
jgi:hypothetical protein